MSLEPKNKFKTSGIKLDHVHWGSGTITCHMRFINFGLNDSFVTLGWLTGKLCLHVNSCHPKNPIFNRAQWLRKMINKLMWKNGCNSVKHEWVLGYLYLSLAKVYFCSSPIVSPFLSHYSNVGFSLKSVCLWRRILNKLFSLNGLLVDVRRMICLELRVFVGFSPFSMFRQ